MRTFYVLVSTAPDSPGYVADVVSRSTYTQEVRLAIHFSTALEATQARRGAEKVLGPLYFCRGKYYTDPIPLTERT